MKKMTLVVGLASLLVMVGSGCTTVATSAAHTTEHEKAVPRYSRGSLARVDVRNPEQRMADNAPHMPDTYWENGGSTNLSMRRTGTGSGGGGIPVIGSIFQALFKLMEIANGSVELLSHETWHSPPVQ